MKIAIIGAGVIGRVHAKALCELGTPASAVCDIRREAALSIAEFCEEGVRIYTDWREMLEDFAPDAVHICTPHDLHAEMCIEALGRNINVLCEKPLCISLESLEAVLEAERRSGATLGVCHQNRYNTVNVYLKKYLEGKSIKSAYGNVVWHRDEAYYSSGDWRGTLEREGGGVLINQALHTLDILLWTCGMPSKVCALKGNLKLKDTIEVEDTVAMHCFGQTDFSFFATVAAAADMPVQMSFRLEDGEKLFVLPHWILSNGRVIAEDDMSATLGKECYGNGHIRLIDDYYRSIEQGRAFAIDGNEAAKVIKVILGAYRSNSESVDVR